MSIKAAPLFDGIKANPSCRIAIVRSLWHGDLTNALVEDAKQALIKAGIAPANIIEAEVPGSFEMPLKCQQLILQEKPDGVIAFGVIVQGETHHAALIADAAAKGIMDVQLKTGVPIMFEILFVDRLEDAVKRSLGREGKGALAASTLIATLACQHDL